MTTFPPFNKVVVPCGPHDYDAFLDDNYIGSFQTPSQAQAELDRVAYEQAPATRRLGCRAAQRRLFHQRTTRWIARLSC